MRTQLLGLLALTWSCGVAGQASAQEQLPCVCLVPAKAAQGLLTEVTGNVLATQSAGFAPASQGTALSAGARVLVGPNGSAKLSMAKNCSIDLHPNTSATLVPQQENICLQVLSSGSTFALRETISVSPSVTYGQSQPAARRRFGLPEKLAVTGFSAGMAGYIFDDKDEAAVRSR